MIPNVADRPVDIRHALGNRELRLTAMHYRKGGKSVPEQFLHEQRLNVVVVRDPATADAQHDRAAIGVLLGRKDVHGQGGAILAAIDHVFLPRIRIIPPRDGRR